jgi:hypothetical protein
MITDLMNSSLSRSRTFSPHFQLTRRCRCDGEVQKLISTQTFEDLITTQNGMLVSRALVNVVIDQQIGLQISVRT